MCGLYMDQVILSDLKLGSQKVTLKVLVVRPKGQPGQPGPSDELTDMNPTRLPPVSGILQTGGTSNFSFTWFNL